MGLPPCFGVLVTAVEVVRITLPPAFFLHTLALDSAGRSPAALLPYTQAHIRQEEAATKTASRLIFHGGILGDFRGIEYSSTYLRGLGKIKNKN
jgi:hypothetical protein